MLLFEKPLYLYLFIVAIFVSMRIPYIGVAIRVFNTLIHELSHAIIAFITSGKIIKIELSSDTSGSMLSISKNKISLFFTSIAGYPLAATFGYLFFWLVKNHLSTYALYTLFFVHFFVLLLYVRNLFGAIWSICFLALMFYLTWINNIQYIEFTVFVMAVVLSLEALYTPVELLLIALNDPNKAGDAKIMSSVTKIPALFWAFVFVATNGWIVYHSVVDFLI